VSFHLEPSAPAGDYKVLFDDRPLGNVVVAGAVITATIPTDYLSHPGEFPIVIENASLGLRVPAGELSVLDDAPDNG
jgi:hypothetical protein